MHLRVPTVFYSPSSSTNADAILIGNAVNLVFKFFIVSIANGYSLIFICKYFNNARLKLLITVSLTKSTLILISLYMSLCELKASKPIAQIIYTSYNCKYVFK